MFGLGAKFGISRGLFSDLVWATLMFCVPSSPNATMVKPCRSYQNLGGSLDLLWFWGRRVLGSDSTWHNQKKKTSGCLKWGLCFCKYLTTTEWCDFRLKLTRRCSHLLAWAFFFFFFLIIRAAVGLIKQGVMLYSVLFWFVWHSTTSSQVKQRPSSQADLC